MGFGNYLHSECWRTFRKKSLWVASGAVLAVVFLVLLLMWAVDRQSEGEALGTSDLVYLLTIFLPLLGIVAVPVVMDAVFSGEYRWGTLKNTVTFGISRGTVYFGKLTAALFFSFLVLGGLLGGFLAASLLLFGPGGEARLLSSLTALGWELLGVIPLWMGALSLICALMFCFHSGTAAVFAYFGILVGGTVGLSLLSVVNSDSAWVFEKALNHTICGGLINWMSEVSLDDEALFVRIVVRNWRDGLLHAGLFSVLGYLGFRRTEVK